MGETTYLEDWLDELREPGEGPAGLEAQSRAFDDLIRRFQRRLAALSSRALRGFPTVRQRAETDDVLVEAQVRIHRQLRRFDPARAPDGWIGPDGRMHVRHFLRLAGFEIRRALLDLKGSLHRAPATLAIDPDGRDPFAELADHRPPETDRLAEIDEISALVDCLDGVMLDVFLQVRLCGLSQREAGRVLDLPESTVRMHLTKATLLLGKEWRRRRELDS